MPRYTPLHLRCFRPSCLRDSEDTLHGVRRSMLCLERLEVVLQPVVLLLEGRVLI
ncbi:unnamed protein product [Ectocarpus sp. 12 AP-2014]